MGKQVPTASLKQRPHELLWWGSFGRCVLWAPSTARSHDYRVARGRVPATGAEVPNGGRLGCQPRVRAAPAAAEPDRSHRRVRDLGSSMRMRFGQRNGFVLVRAIWAAEFGDVLFFLCLYVFIRGYRCMYGSIGPVYGLVLKKWHS
jgi:hypothetical protein